MWDKMMGRHSSNKLTDLVVKKQTTPGKYSDGNRVEDSRSTSDYLAHC